MFDNGEEKKSNSGNDGCGCLIWLIAFIAVCNYGGIAWILFFILLIISLDD